MLTDPTRTNIVEVATMLDTRRKANKRTTLVLGARAGGFFRSKELFSTLQIASLRDFKQLTPLEQFTECYQVLNSPGQFSDNDLDGILKQALNEVAISEADLCLAELIKDNIFDMIISTNIDDLLENALEQVDMKDQSHFDVIIPGHKATAYIDYTEKPFSCRIIKAFGDLSSKVYSIVKRQEQLAIPLGNRETVRTLLERTLARDILAIGLDPTWDAEILAAFPARSTATTYWYVNEQEPEQNLLLTRTWQGGLVKFIVGEEGNYEYFIKALHWHLRKEQPGNYKLSRQITSQLSTISSEIIKLRAQYSELSQLVNRLISTLEKQ